MYIQILEKSAGLNLRNIRLKLRKTNNPADHIDPAANENSPAVTGINPVDLRWAEHSPFSSLQTCPHVWFSHES